MRSALVAVALIAATVLVTPGVAHASAGGGRGGDESRASGEILDDGAEARAQRTSTGDQSERPRRRRGGTIRCTYYDAGSGEQFDPGSLDPNADWGEGIEVIRICVDTSTGEEVSFQDGLILQPGAGPVQMDPRSLAELQVSRLSVAPPGIGTNPDPNRDQVVRVPTWLWVTTAWAPVSATATAGDVTATVTATPNRVVWEMGDGHSVTCFGPGTRYDQSRPASEQSTDCSYTYQRTSVGQPGERFQASATTFWTVTFTSNIGPGGSLGEVSDTSVFTLRVTQAQALNE